MCRWWCLRWLRWQWSHLPVIGWILAPVLMMARWPGAEQDWALIAPRGWESNMSSHQCPVSQPSSVPVSSWAAPGGPGCHLAATWLPHTRHRCAFTDLQVIAFSWLWKQRAKCRYLIFFSYHSVTMFICDPTLLSLYNGTRQGQC